MGLAFGLGRGLPVLATARVVDGPCLRHLHRAVAGLEAPVRRLSVGGSLAAALLLVAGALG